jgi:hypothetical protein
LRISWSGTAVDDTYLGVLLEVIDDLLSALESGHERESIDGMGWPRRRPRAVVRMAAQSFWNSQLAQPGG